MIAEILETVMILAFGLSWPLSIYKSVKSRTAKGKSLQFEIFIWLGYIAGIVMKCIQFFVIGKSGPIFVLSWVFYCLNFIEITIDMLLYFRNVRLDKENEGKSFHMCPKRQPAGCRFCVASKKDGHRMPGVRLRLLS